MGDQSESSHAQFLPHELKALQTAQLSSDEVNGLLADVEALSAKLYRQLVDWHTKYPEKPTLADSNQFWAMLKELRAAQFEVESLRTAIREEEKRAQTLAVRLETSQGTISHIERAFNGYLDRMHER